MWMAAAETELHFKISYTILTQTGKGEIFRVGTFLTYQPPSYVMYTDFTCMLKNTLTNIIYISLIEFLLFNSPLHVREPKQVIQNFYYIKFIIKHLYLILTITRYCAKYCISMRLPLRKRNFFIMKLFTKYHNQFVVSTDIYCNECIVIMIKT